MAPKSRPDTVTPPTRHTSPPPTPARRPGWPFSLRETVRFAFFIALLGALVEYARFWRYVQTGFGAAAWRPSVADAFLPLGGLAALKTWLATGSFDRLHPVAIVALLAIVGTAWLFRRAPCSWLCPIGMVSEYLGDFGKTVFGGHLKVPKALDRTLIGLKYAGTFVLVFLICATPVEATHAFVSTPFYAVADMKLFDVYTTFGAAIAIGVGVIVVLSLFVKSAWCRYLCPYGALQGMFGLLSPVTIAKDDDGCTGCARCNKACPNGVDVAHASGAVTSGECMGCTGCVTACPKPGILELRVHRTRIDPTAFGLAFIAVFTLAVVVAAVTGHLGAGLPPEAYRQMLHIAADVRLPL
jgi:polyferredoxin